MKFWKFTFLLGFSGLTLALIGLVTSGGGHGYGMAVLWLIFMPVMIVAAGFDAFWFNVLERQRETGLYVPILIGILMAGGFIQFALFGFAVDLIRKNRKNKSSL